MMAVSAMDMALHDLAARSQGISVARMLGGALRDRDARLCQRALHRRGRRSLRRLSGRRSMTCSAVASAPSSRGSAPRPGRTALAMRAMRRPGRAGRRADGGHQPGLHGRRRDRERAAHGGGRPSLDRGAVAARGHRRLPGGRRRRRAARIAGGEALGSLAAFRDFLSARTFSVLQPDLTVCGGFTRIPARRGARGRLRRAGHAARLRHAGERACRAADGRAAGATPRRRADALSLHRDRRHAEPAADAARARWSRGPDGTHGGAGPAGHRASTSIRRGSSPG